MTTTLGNKTVEEELRDKVFASIRHENDNNICLDCEKKNPKWASVHLGIHLCIDCAGKHRQYGVNYSFIKSTNLDTWNEKQLLFMQKGSNIRAMDYFRKCGIISNISRHIDYKSQVVQKYKAILTEQVESQLSGVPMIKKKQKFTNKDQIADINAESQNIDCKDIPKAEEIQIQNTQKNQKSKKKKQKKKMGKQIQIEDFENIEFDNGVPKVQKAFYAPQNEKKKNQPIGEFTTGQTEQTKTEQNVKEVQKQKELSTEQLNEKIEKLKNQSNVKAVSSEDFKDKTSENLALKNNLKKFSNSTSISSSSFFDQKQQNEGALKGMGKIYEKITGYWHK